MTKNEKEINALSKIIIQNYNQKNSRNLKKIIKTKPINILIESIEKINDIDILKYILFCSINIRVGQIFISLNFNNKLSIINNSSSKLIRDIFDDIEIDDVFEFVNDLPSAEFKNILLSISPNVRKQLISLSKYEEGEVGSIMNTSFVKLYDDFTITQAVKTIEINKEEIELNGIIFIINREEKLVGQIHIYDILLEKKRSIKLKKIMNKTFVSVNNHEDIENLVNMFGKYDLRVIPVINSSDILLGFVNDGDIISAIQEENTEDIYKMYGINELNQPYIRTRVIDIVKSRILWLILLMIASTFTSVALEGLEKWANSLFLGPTLSTFILVPIIPIISGTSGNAGSQAAATIIRSLSIGEIKINEYRKIIFKEFLIAIIIGLILSIINFVRLMIFYQIFPENLLKITSALNLPTLASIISVSISGILFLSILLSKFIGSILPIFAIKIKMDPAAMASPLLTTLIDTLSITILFSIGTGIIFALSQAG